MDAILLQILNGLDKGGAYALIALGLTHHLRHAGRRQLRPRRAVHAGRLLCRRRESPVGCREDRRGSDPGHRLGNASGDPHPLCRGLVRRLRHAPDRLLRPRLHPDRRAGDAAGRHRHGTRPRPFLLQAASRRADPRHLRSGDCPAGDRQGPVRCQPDSSAGARSISSGMVDFGTACWASKPATSSIPSGA